MRPTVGRTCRVRLRAESDTQSSTYIAILTKCDKLYFASTTTMNITPESICSIGSFPIPWARHFAEALGNASYRLLPAKEKANPRAWLGIASSSVHKNNYMCQDWQDSLQSALMLASRQGWGIQFAEDTPYSPLIQHACHRFSIPIRIIRVQKQKDTQAKRMESSDCSAYVNQPEILLLVSHNDSGNDKLPLHDRAVVFLSEILFVLELNPGGKVEKLLDKRLACPFIPPGTTYLSLRAKKEAKATKHKSIDWLERGAIGWLNCIANNDSEPQSHSNKSASLLESYQPIVSLDLLTSSPRNYLIHCTRSRRGPWPDQTVAQFHDEVLHRPWVSQPTALETLERILQQQRLIATDHCRRGIEPSVCFSSKDIRQLLAMRKFQSHLARWDWEPYGIMIDLVWMTAHGAKQVSYIDSATARRLNKEQLTFCQVVNRDVGSTNWREEQEWRLAGDLRLSQIPFSKAIVFVPTRAEAQALQRYSRWPIATTNE